MQRPTRRTLVTLLGPLVTGCAAELWPNDDVDTSTCTPAYVLPSVPDSDDIQVEATDVMAPVLPFTARGRGSKQFGAIALQDGVGEIQIGCEPFDVVICRHAREDDAWFTGVAVNPRRVYEVNIRCSFAGHLKSAYYLGSDGTTANESLGGTCEIGEAPVPTRVRLPAVSMPYPEGVVGYDIRGPEIALGSDGQGRVQIDGALLQLVAVADAGDDLTALLLNDTATRLTVAKIWTYSDDMLVSLTQCATLPGFLEDRETKWLDAQITTP